MDQHEVQGPATVDAFEDLQALPLKGVPPPGYGNDLWLREVGVGIVSCCPSMPSTTSGWRVSSGTE